MQMININSIQCDKKSKSNQNTIYAFCSHLPFEKKNCKEIVCMFFVWNFQFLYTPFDCTEMNEQEER